MAKYHVKQMTNTALQEVKNDRFIVKNPEGEIEEVPFDYGFICLGMRANTPLLSEIEEAFSDTNVEIVNMETANVPAGSSRVQKKVEIS